MSREINGRILMVVSDDGTRCDDTCPHAPLGAELACYPYARRNPFGNSNMLRTAACIAAERAARDVPPQDGGARGQHPDDSAVDRFADAMKTKLAASRAKGRGGWDDPERCSVSSLAQLLVDHVAKGDPVDVANFAMMLHQRGADRDALRAASDADTARLRGVLIAELGLRYAEDAVEALRVLRATATEQSATIARLREREARVRAAIDMGSMPGRDARTTLDAIIEVLDGKDGEG